MRSTIDVEKKVSFFELGELGEGSIEPGKDQQEHLEEFTQRVGLGEFHKNTDIVIPVGCIDGRCGGSLKPNSAGGTESLMVADDLTNAQFAANSGTTADAYENVLRFIAKTHPIGGHDDGGRDETKTGCGANDKLELIYSMIVKRSDAIRNLAESIGIDVDNVAHQHIIERASQRSEFSHGPELLERLEACTSNECIDHLRGQHNEVIAVINTHVGTTLDRDELKREFGDMYEAFNVDVWSFAQAANCISTSNDSEEQRHKIAALAYYNFAAALVLGGPKLRVVVVE